MYLLYFYSICLLQLPLFVLNSSFCAFSFFTFYLHSVASQPLLLLLLCFFTNLNGLSFTFHTSAFFFALFTYITLNGTRQIQRWLFCCFFCDFAFSFNFNWIEANDRKWAQNTSIFLFKCKIIQKIHCVYWVRENNFYNGRISITWITCYTDISVKSQVMYNRCFQAFACEFFCVCMFFFVACSLFSLKKEQ